MMYREQIEAFRPGCDQEKGDREVILEYIDCFPDTILTRANRIAHITSSGLVLNPSLDKVLLAHHNIYKTWAWTGGHADGDGDLLRVALREAREETGVEEIAPLCGEMLSLDILPVWGHVKRGRYVSAHLHLSAAYVLVADESQPLRARPEENSGVRWIFTDELERYSNEPDLIVVYNKLIARARAL